MKCGVAEAKNSAPPSQETRQSSGWRPLAGLHACHSAARIKLISLVEQRPLVIHRFVTFWRRDHPYSQVTSSTCCGFRPAHLHDRGMVRKLVWGWNQA